MRAILLNTGEMNSPRWHRLCGLLGAKDPGECWQTFGHLVGWYLQWSGQPELDSGIWFRPSLNEIGSWAGVTNGDLKWGRALLAAGYVGLIKKLYPEPLASLRDGYAALDASGGVMLDEFFGVHRRRANATTLICYVLDRNKRVQFARSLHVDAAFLEGSGQIPVGWLDAAESKGQKADDGPRFEEKEPKVAHAPAVDAAPPHRNVVGFTRNEERPAALHTGNSPSDAMLRAVREWKHADPLRALMSMDNSPEAAFIWRKAVAKDRARVCEEIAGLTETDSRWALLRNPASVIMANLRRLGLLEN